MVLHLPKITEFRAQEAARMAMNIMKGTRMESKPRIQSLIRDQALTKSIELSLRLLIRSLRMMNILPEMIDQDLLWRMNRSSQAVDAKLEMEMSLSKEVVISSEEKGGSCFTVFRLENYCCLISVF